MKEIICKFVKKITFGRFCLGYFIEGKYNKYWNREWYDFKLGVNYVIF